MQYTDLKKKGFKLLKQKHYQDAIHCLREALAKVDESRYPDADRRFLASRIGFAYFKSGAIADYKQAIVFYKMALEYVKYSKDPNVQKFYCNNYLANSYYKLDMFDETKEYATAALKYVHFLPEEKRHMERGAILTLVARVHYKSGSPVCAAAMRRRAIYNLKRTKNKRRIPTLAIDYNKITGEAFKGNLKRMPICLSATVELFGSRLDYIETQLMLDKELTPELEQEADELFDCIELFAAISKDPDKAIILMDAHSLQFGITLLIASLSRKLNPNELLAVKSAEFACMGLENATRDSPTKVAEQENEIVEMLFTDTVAGVVAPQDITIKKAENFSRQFRRRLLYPLHVLIGNLLLENRHRANLGDKYLTRLEKKVRSLEVKLKERRDRAEFLNS